MRIVLDATYSLGRELSGVGVYCRELLFGLARAHPERDFRFAYRPHRLAASLAESLPANAGRAVLHDSFVFPRPDLFHGLNQRLPRVRLPRTVVTFHDLFVLTGEYSTPEFRTRFAAQARDAAERAHLVIAVSAFTGGQVRELLGVEPARIRVIPHGVWSGALATAAVREPMILSVGALQVRKNTVRLVEAFERTPQPWRLVLAGGSGYGAAKILERIAASSRRADITLAGYVGREELEALYARASVFAFPSLDEGFGLPVLEAMARGVPVLTSNRSALPEVAGEAALLVEPERVESITAGLLRLCSDEDLRRELAEKGRLRAAGFRWEEAVTRTWEAYGELA